MKEGSVLLFVIHILNKWQFILIPMLVIVSYDLYKSEWNNVDKKKARRLQ